jgi:hypothetical protein
MFFETFMLLRRYSVLFEEVSFELGNAVFYAVNIARVCCSLENNSPIGWVHCIFRNNFMIACVRSCIENISMVSCLCCIF